MAQFLVLIVFFSWASMQAWPGKSGRRVKSSRDGARIS